MLELFPQLPPVLLLMNFWVKGDPINQFVSLEFLLSFFKEEMPSHSTIILVHDMVLSTQSLGSDYTLAIMRPFACYGRFCDKK